MTLEQALEIARTFHMRSDTDVDLRYDAQQALNRLSMEVAESPMRSLGWQDGVRFIMNCLANSSVARGMEALNGATGGDDE